MTILREPKFSRQFTVAPPVLEELCQAVVVKKEPQGKTPAGLSAGSHDLRVETERTRWRLQAAKIEIGGGAQSRVAAPCH